MIHKLPRYKLDTFLTYYNLELVAYERWGKDHTHLEIFAENKSRRHLMDSRSNPIKAIVPNSSSDKVMRSAFAQAMSGKTVFFNQEQVLETSIVEI